MPSLLALPKPTSTPSSHRLTTAWLPLSIFFSSFRLRCWAQKVFLFSRICNALRGKRQQIRLCWISFGSKWPCFCFQPKSKPSTDFLAWALLLYFALNPCNERGLLVARNFCSVKLPPPHGAFNAQAVAG